MYSPMSMKITPPTINGIVSSMYETAAEPCEALNMKIKSVKFDREGAVVSLGVETEGMLEVRRLRVVDSVPYLQAWLNVHPMREDPEAPLWPVRKGGLKALGYDGLWRLFSKLKARSGLKKPVRPNLLRHARLTEMAKYLPEQKLKKFAGWRPGSRMAAVYVHLAGKDLDEDILRMHGKVVVKEKAPLKGALAPKGCPRCGHENAATHTFCARCGMLMDREEVLEEVETQSLLRDIEMLAKLPGYREFFEGMVKDAKAKLAELKSRPEKD